MQVVKEMLEESRGNEKQKWVKFDEFLSTAEFWLYVGVYEDFLIEWNCAMKTLQKRSVGIEEIYDSLQQFLENITVSFGIWK